MYTIKLMNDAEYDLLPYKYVRESLGCANPKTKTAYVRKTGVKPLDMFVTSHEIDELVNKYSDHETEGIRYKKGKDIFVKYVAPIAAGLLTGGLGTALGLGGTMTGILGTGAGALTGGINAYQEEPKSTAMGALTGALGGYGGTSIGSGAVKGFTGATAGNVAGEAYKNPFISGAKGALGFGGGGTVGSAAQNEAFSGIDAAAPGIKGYVDYGTGTVGQSLLPSTTSSSLPLYTATVSNLSRAAGREAVKQAGSSAAGQIATPSATSTLAGSQAQKPLTQYTQQTGLAPTPASTQLGFEATKQAAGAGTLAPTIQAAGPQAMKQAVSQGFPKVATQTMLGKILSTAGEYVSSKQGINMLMGGATSLIGGGLGPQVQDFSAFDSAAYTQLYDKMKTGAITPIPEQTKAAIASECDTSYNTARRNLEQRYKALRPYSDVTNDSDYAQAIKELETEFGTAKANAIAGATLGLNQDQSEMLAQMAEMDIYTLAYQSGLSIQEAQRFQEMLSGLGYVVANSGESNESLLSKLAGLGG